MTEATGDEGVMQVGLVGMERTLAMQHAVGHDTKGVEDGDYKDAEGEGNKTEVVFAGKGSVDFAFRHLLGEGELKIMRATKRMDDEPGDEDAHHHGAGIANEHPGGLAEDVMQEEGHEGCCHDGGKGCIPEVVILVEHASEEEAQHDAEAGGEAVDAVDHIDGVDDAHSGKDGEGNGIGVGELVDAPHAMKVVDTGVGGEDEHQDGQHLDNETNRGRESLQVVERTEVEHDSHHEDDGEQRGDIDHTGGHGQSAQDADEDGQSAQDGHGFLLQLTGIGIVHEFLCLGDAQDFEIHPHYCQEG